MIVTEPGRVSTVTLASGTTPASRSCAITSGSDCTCSASRRTTTAVCAPCGISVRRTNVSVVATGPSSPNWSKPGIGFAVGRRRGVVQNDDEPTLDLLAHHVLPTACLGMYVFPFETDDVHQQALCQPVLTHDRDREIATLVGEFQMSIAGDHQQAVTLHTRNSLADGGSALFEPFGDPRPEWDYALFFQVVDRPEIHLRGVD